MELLRGGGRTALEHRYALGGAIDPICYAPMQMGVEMGGRPKRWMSVTALPAHRATAGRL